MTDKNDEELSTIEVAKLLKLAPATLRKWRSTHEQPGLIWRKRFNKVFYLKSDVMAFKEANTKIVVPSKEIYL